MTSDLRGLQGALTDAKMARPSGFGVDAEENSILAAIFDGPLAGKRYLPIIYRRVVVYMYVLVQYLGRTPSILSYSTYNYTYNYIYTLQFTLAVYTLSD